jgi:TIR domain-containing protein/stage II sporulation SpoE-like protein/NACHT domain-containing protein
VNGSDPGPEIFLSYASADAERAQRLVAILEQQGWSVWWDRERIPPGQRFDRAIGEAVEAARCVVVLWSRASTKSDWVREEAEAGRKRSVLVPVLLDDVELPFGFRTIETARLIDWSGDDHPELQLLFESIASHAGRPAGRRAAEPYFAIQRHVIDEHAKGFIPRTHVEAALDEFLRTQPRGCFVIRGGPGQGKTALACHLVKHRAYPHHFVNRGGGRSDPRLIIRSLLSQLPPGAAKLPETLPDLTKALQDRLSREARQAERVVILIDALDELASAGADDFAFLAFETLPAGVFMVVTCRPGERLDQLQDHFFATPFRICDLAPLDLSEMGALLRAQWPHLSDGDLERIADSSQGNPLYLRAVSDEMSAGAAFDTSQLPAGIEGYFRNATRRMRSASGELLNRTLGLLATARRPLSLRELSQITGASQRVIDEEAIRPVRAYLLEFDRQYSFYHARFQEFVIQELFYEDELIVRHRELAAWLLGPNGAGSEYCLSSLAYHLYQSGDLAGLQEQIDESFLSAKVRRLGYGVLEDVDLLSRAYLDGADPRAVERCVSLVAHLRDVAGGDIVDEVARVTRGYPAGHDAFRGKVIAPPMHAIAGLDVYAGTLPKLGVSADFFELIALQDSMVAVIGDAPGAGIKSAFVARFLANLARRVITASPRRDLGSVLDELRARTSDHPFFERVSLALLEIQPGTRVLRIANAGHPYPIRYSSRSKECIRIPVRGGLLNDLDEPIAPGRPYEERLAEYDPGDVIVLITDGLTEAGLLQGEPYGDRFMRVVEESSGSSARKIGEAILDSWRAHPRQADLADEVTVAVIAIPEDRGGIRA